MVQAEGLEPSRDCSPRIFLPLRLSPPSPCTVRREGGFVVWTIPSPYGLDFGVRLIFRLDAARLVSTPSPVQGLGSGLPCERFPRVWAVLHLGFPTRALNAFKSVAYTVPPRLLNELCLIILYKSSSSRSGFLAFLHFFLRRVLIAAASRLVLIWAA